MFTCTYIIEKIDGDYAFLKRDDNPDASTEPKLVARALLPADITEGSKLLYEYLQYTIIA